MINESVQERLFNKNTAIMNGLVFGLTFALTNDPVLSTTSLVLAKFSDLFSVFGIGRSKEGKFLDFVSTIGLAAISHLPFAQLTFYTLIKFAQISYKGLTKVIGPDKGQTIDFVLEIRRKDKFFRGNCGHVDEVVDHFGGKTWFSPDAIDTWGHHGQHYVGISRNGWIVDYTGRSLIPLLPRTGIIKGKVNPNDHKQIISNLNKIYHSLDWRIR